MLNRHQTFLAIVTRISRDHRISDSALTKHLVESIGKTFGDTEVNDTIHPHPCPNSSVPSEEWYYIKPIKCRENMAWLSENTGYMRQSIICLKALKDFNVWTSHKFNEETELTFL